MLRNHQIRAFARRQLRGNWGTALLAIYLEIFVLLLSIAVPAAVFGLGVYMLPKLSGAYRVPVMAGLGIVIALLLLGCYMIAVALGLGYEMMFLRLVRGEKIRVGEIFRGFQAGNRYWSFLGVSVLMTVISLLLASPSYIGSYIYGAEAANTMLLEGVCNILSFFFSLFFAGAPVFAAMEGGRTAIENMKLSFRTMERRKFRFFTLQLSFLPWYLLIFIPMVIVITLVVILTADSEGSSVGLLLLSVFMGLILGGVMTPYITAAQTIFFLSAYSEDQSKNGGNEE